MKVTKRIHNAVVAMYEAREKWERAKAQASGNPTMGEGWATPRVEYLPGKGFAINGVEWPYSSEYIIQHFEKMTADYKAQTQMLDTLNGVAEAANDDSDIPF